MPTHNKFIVWLAINLSFLKGSFLKRKTLSFEPWRAPVLFPAEKLRTILHFVLKLKIIDKFETGFKVRRKWMYIRMRKHVRMSGKAQIFSYKLWGGSPFKDKHFPHRRLPNSPFLKITSKGTAMPLFTLTFINSWWLLMLGLSSPVQSRSLFFFFLSKCAFSESLWSVWATCGGPHL